MIRSAQTYVEATILEWFRMDVPFTRVLTFRVENKQPSTGLLFLNVEKNIAVAHSSTKIAPRNVVSCARVEYEGEKFSGFHFYP